jgi:hypothetical protein
MGGKNFSLRFAFSILFWAIFICLVFGFLVILDNPFEKPNYGTQVIAGILYVIASVFSIGFGTAKATAVTCFFTTIVGIFIIIEILGNQI